MGSAVVEGSVWDTRIILYCFDNARASDDSVLTLDNWVCWSIVEAQLGHFLDVNPYGEPHAPYSSGRSGMIMGGYRAILALHKGDEKYLQKVYRTSRSGNAKNVCMVCNATSERGPLVYTLHGPQAAHRNTLLDTPTFITDVCGIHTWVKIPGWSPQILAHDWLHLVDLSLIPEASASCIVELAGEGVFGGGSIDDKLRRAYVLFVKACQLHRIRALAAKPVVKLGWFFVYEKHLRQQGTNFFKATWLQKCCLKPRTWQGWQNIPSNTTSNFLCSR